MGFGGRFEQAFEGAAAGGAVADAVGLQLDPLVAALASSGVDVAAWSGPFGLFHGISPLGGYLGSKILLIKGMGCDRYPWSIPLGVKARSPAGCAGLLCFSYYVNDSRLGKTSMPTIFEIYTVWFVWVGGILEVLGG
jgi:hypothetical protein